MQPADAATVLGDFDDTTFAHGDVTTTFFRREEQHWVRTDDATGELVDFPVRYTFGVEPLQQYLVEVEGGRLQALGIAWDTRPSAAGGQRWFHLYPDQDISHDDALHWSGLYQNWNYMCAECHSTDLRKNYDPASGTYDTTWAEIDVACEACHGPASTHVKLAQDLAALPPPPDWRSGLVVALRGDREAEWIMDMETGIATRSPAGSDAHQIDACAPCHSRRAQLTDDSSPGAPLLDGHRPALLEPGLYFADGQIQDEVYVWGSFVQSRMYRAGVVCSNCHDPHSLQVRGEGNSACAGCHLPERFDTPEHHHHDVDGAGAACVECHMPARTYMVVDPRHDHSFRVPRPDLAGPVGAPDACTSCHDDKSPEWADASLRDWYGDDRRDTAHPGEVLALGRSGGPGAGDALAELALDESAPAIVRATALALLGPLVERQHLEVLQRAIRDRDPLLRFGALRAIDVLPIEARVGMAGSAISDPLLAIRLEAARMLAGAPDELLAPTDRRNLASALAEYRLSLRLRSDHPEAWLAMALLEQAEGALTAADSAYREALELDADFVPALVNLADLRRLQSRDEEGEALLARALEIAPDLAEAHHALGLLRVRRQDLSAALPALAKAAELAPGQVRFAYVYGVALESDGKIDEALAVLAAAQRRQPDSRELLQALVSFSVRHERREEALEWVRRLAAVAPDDAAAQRLLRELESAGRSQ
jgi:tetratricopeptide (TPR) repeat protein